MAVVAKLDELGWSAWLATMILSFIVFWPLGLAILGYMIWSGRMSGEKKCGPGRWFNLDAHSERWGRRSKNKAYRSSGNSAFDDYRDATLRRLEEEQDEFHSFLDRLRKAKDKAEFDQFMAERKNHRADSDGAEEAPAT